MKLHYMTWGEINIALWKFSIIKTHIIPAGYSYVSNNKRQKKLMYFIKFSFVLLE